MSEDAQAVVEVTDDDFEAQTAVGWLLVDFYATWCPHCKAFRPIYEKVAGDYDGDVKFLAADVDRSSEAADSLSVMSIPTVVLLKDGEKIDANSGVLPPDQLVAWIDEHSGA